jgi:ABC-2 type transport system permease protein
MTFGILLLLYIGGSVITSNYNLGFFTNVLQWLSVFDRFSLFTQGILSLTQIVYYVSFAAVFLFLTVRTVERRRWSEV